MTREPARRTWLLVAARSTVVGGGHESRVRLLQSAALARGIDAVVVPVTWAPTPGEPTAAPPVADDPARLLTGRDDVEVLVTDGPDGFVDQFANLLPASALGVAFRMYGIEPGAMPWEDVSITPSLDPTFTRSTVEPRRHVLLGGADAILVRASCFRRPDDPPRSSADVLVTMGRADPRGLTRLACDALASLDPTVSVTVVIGALNAARDDLHAAFGERFHVVDEGRIDFDGTLHRTTLAVINGGLTRYECVAAGTPFVAISSNAAQAAFTEKVVSRGVGRHAGQVDDMLPERLRQAVDALLAKATLRSRMSARARGLLDADATPRLVGRIEGWVREHRSRLGAMPNPAPGVGSDPPPRTHR